MKIHVGLVGERATDRLADHGLVIHQQDHDMVIREGHGPTMLKTGTVIGLCFRHGWVRSAARILATAARFARGSESRLRPAAARPLWACRRQRCWIHPEPLCDVRSAAG